MRALQAELGDLDDAEAGVLVDLLRSYLAVEEYGDAVALAEAMPEFVRRVPQVREQLAFALNRLDRRVEAEEILLRLLDERGADSETYGLLGRVYKDQWGQAVAEGTPSSPGVCWTRRSRRTWPDSRRTGATTTRESTPCS